MLADICVWQFTIKSVHKILEHVNLKNLSVSPMPSAYNIAFIGLWPHIEVLARTSDDLSWCTLPVWSLTSRWDPVGPKHSPNAHYPQAQGMYLANCQWLPTPACLCRGNLEWMAWGPQRCPLPITSLLDPPQCVYSWGWTHPPWRSHCCSTIRQERCIHTIHKGHQDIKNCQLPDQNGVYWSGMNMDSHGFQETCETYWCLHTHYPCKLLYLVPTQEHTLQILSTDLFHFDWCEWLVISDFYSKMLIMQ